MKGDGRVFQRHEIWWIAYYCDGREYRESSKSRDRGNAVRLLRQRVGEVAAGTFVGRPTHRTANTRSVTMLDLLDLQENEYRLNGRSSRINYLSLRRLRRRFADCTVQACTSLTITQYMADMHREGRKPPTINREISVLRSALRLAHRLELIASVPAVRLLPDHALRNEFFNRPEIDALLPCLPDHLRDVVLFAYLTGWRKGEIMGLRWTNVNRGAAVIRLEPAQSKNRDARVLALNKEMAALIERRWKARKVGRALSTHVFHRNGNPLKEFRKLWLKACHRAGLGHRMFHSLRRTAARNMSMQGIPEKVIMSIMGHKSRDMLDRYNNVTEADQRAYLDRLSGFNHGQ